MLCTSALLRLCVFIIKVFRRTVQGQCKFTNNSEDGEKIQAKKPFFFAMNRKLCLKTSIFTQVLRIFAL